MGVGGPVRKDCTKVQQKFFRMTAGGGERRRWPNSSRKDRLKKVNAITAYVQRTA